jgi:cytidylate kinase
MRRNVPFCYLWDLITDALAIVFVENRIIIAIDGYSSCGKSTLAKALAKALGYLYVDSGAMYRAVTLYFLEHGVALDDPEAVSRALQDIRITLKLEDGNQVTFLNGRNVEQQIREMRVSQWVSPVSTVPAVRRALVAQQQALGKKRGVVMDGRDIGTVVFPDAELKLFMTASTNVRAQRRLAELLAKGYDETRIEEVEKNLLDRDRIDSTRDDSPLRQAEDALVLDNTQLTPQQQFEVAMQWAEEKLRAKETLG